MLCACWARRMRPASRAEPVTLTVSMRVVRAASDCGSNPSGVTIAASYLTSAARRLRRCSSGLRLSNLFGGMRGFTSRDTGRHPAAAAAIEGAVLRTPMRHSRTLSEIAGCEIWLKFENRQFTASFKERGALNKSAVADAGRTQARRGGDERRQSCPGRRLSCRAAGHSRHHRDAGDHALHQGQAHPRFRRHGDPGGPRPATRPTRRRASSPDATASLSSIPMTIRGDRGPGHGGAGDAGGRAANWTRWWCRWAAAA